MTRLIVLIVIMCAVPAIVRGSSLNAPLPHFLVEQVADNDAPIRPFAIAVSSDVNATRDLVTVPKATYDELLRTIQASALEIGTDHHPGLMFKVTSYMADNNAVSYNIDQRTMSLIVSEIKEAFRISEQRMPAFLLAIGSE